MISAWKYPGYSNLGNSKAPINPSDASGVLQKKVVKTVLKFERQISIGRP